MRKLFLPLIAMSFLVSCVSSDQKKVSMPSAYPKTAKVSQIDDYHGTAVADPYRWLEDDNSAETKAWVEAQNKVTFGYLDQIPERPAIKRRLTALWNYERFGAPFKRGSRYFITRNDGLQNQNVLFTMASLEGTPEVLLDPNQLSSDGTVSLAGYSVSEDGMLLAYGLSTSGSDWQEWRVRDVQTGIDLPDRLQWVKFSGASWTHDGKGFYYSRYDEPDGADRLKGVNHFQKLYFHRLGMSQAEDRLVYERPDQKEWGFGGSVTEDGRYLIISVWQGTDPKNRVYYQDLTREGAPVVELLDEFDAAYDFLGNDGTVFWFLTKLNAPRGRIIEIDIAQPGREHWREIVPQGAETIRSAGMLNDQFVVSSLKDASSAVKVFRRDGSFAREIPLPGLGTVSGFDGKRTDTEAFFSFTSFTVPGAIYCHDMVTGESTVFRQPKVRFQPDDFITTQVFYPSKDGTRIPMFITHRKDLKRNGKNPVYLYGYGGFNISLTPSFSTSVIAWLEMGGIYVVPNLRGGGEYGQSWHEAGTKLRKQNVFDDFIAAAEWLVNEKYTSPKCLAIGGGSNGGLLVGACMTQRPELFAAALPSVGVMDMLRFHKFTIGWAWTSDYGSSDNREEFAALRNYSPLHNLKGGTVYPATLITTADHDDRVVPAHSFKFASALQEAHAGSNPVLIRIETKAGHGAGKPTSKIIDEVTDRWGFLVRELGLRTPPQW